MNTKRDIDRLTRTLEFAGLLLGVTAAGYLNLSFRVVDVLWAILSTAALPPEIAPVLSFDLDQRLQFVPT